jgi:hypothetical protein
VFFNHYVPTKIFPYFTEFSTIEVRCMLKEKFKKLFIPHSENNFKPDFLELFSMGVMLVLILFSFALANIQALVWVGSDWMVSSILPAVIVDLTNEKRTHESLTALRHNELLDRAAQLKAEDMAQNGYFAHYSPTGVTPWHWFDAVGYNYVNAGENLAVRFTDSSDVIEGWMNSPTHRANIMDGKYTEIGVGTARGEYKGTPTIFVVQLFATQNVQAVTVETVRDSQVAQEEVAQTAPVPQTSVSHAENPNVLAEHTTTPSTSPSSIVFEIPTQPPENSSSTLASTTAESVIVSKEVQQDMYASNTSTQEAVMYSGLATSSRPGIPAILSTGTGGISGYGSPETNLFMRSATQPSIWLQIVYGIMAIIVVIALLLSIIIEWRTQNPVQIAYAGGLLAAMAFLFYIHTMLTSGVSIV